MRAPEHRSRLPVQLRSPVSNRQHLQSLRLTPHFPQVIPVDSRGEALLAALRQPSCPTWSQRRESLFAFEEDDDSTCLYSSTEDLGRKVVSVIRWFQSSSVS